MKSFIKVYGSPSFSLDGKNMTPKSDNPTSLVQSHEVSPKIIRVASEVGQLHHLTKKVLSDASGRCNKAIIKNEH